MLKWLLTLVIALLLLGALSPWLRRIGFGRLPGDIDIKQENFSFYFPLGWSLVISVVLSLVYWLFGK